MGIKTVICHQCQSQNSFSERLGFRETCQSCDADLHACLSCEFYDPTCYQECREPQAEKVQEKNRSNRCEYFSARSGVGSAQAPTKDDLRAAAEALFKKKL